MAPRPHVTTVKDIEDELRDAVRDQYNSEHRDKLTVNSIREFVELVLHLSDGFLKGGQWKARSKQIILDTLVSRDGLESAVPFFPKPVVDAVLPERA